MFASLHRWVLTHDDSKLFVVLYIGLAVLLAILLGLFWLTMVVCIHLVMEMIKQHHFDPRPLPALTRSLWELKLDIGLVLCGLVIGLYIEVVFGLVGIGHAGRAGAQAAARAGMWPRVIRGVLLTLDDVALVAKGATLKKKEEDCSDATEEGIQIEPVAATDETLAATGTDSVPGTAGSPGMSASKSVRSTPASSTTHLEHSQTAPTPEEKPRGAELWGGWIATRWGLGDRMSLGFTAINLLLILAAPLLTGSSLAEVWTAILEDMHPFPDH